MRHLASWAANPQNCHVSCSSGRPKAEVFREVWIFGKFGKSPKNKSFGSRYESLSPANYLSHGISGRLGNAENPAILSVFVSQVVSYALRQSRRPMGTSRFWCIGGSGRGFMSLKEGFANI